MSTHFLGKDGFTWFVGVVEDRIDPTFTGRLRVRCLGYHTDDREILPTADLPWAQILLPVTSSGISGIGQSPSGFVEGSWVMGYFRDGTNAQEPVVLGSLPGRPSATAGAGGFNDPSKTYPRYKDEPDTNRLAVNAGNPYSTTLGLPEDERHGAREIDETNPHLALTLRRSTRITGIATADFDAAKAADDSDITASDTDTWDQPGIPYAGIYPFNHVYESESGHIQEFDDTPNAERIYMAHMRGTSIEMDTSGHRTDIVKASHYTLTTTDNSVSIGGKSDITIGGRHKIYINKDGAENNNYDIQVGPNANVNVQVDTGSINLVALQGKVNVNAGGDYNVKVGGNYTMTVAGNRNVSVSGTTLDNTQGAVQHYGKTIDLN